MGRDRRERGSVLIMVVLALGIFLIGAVGLGIDGSRIYAERQMAQAAADAAAQAAMMSVFDGTNAIGGAHFDATPGSNFLCLVGSLMTPCVYAQSNGFRNIKSGSTCNPGIRCLIGSGNRSGDCVCIDFPGSSVVPGVSLSGSDPTNLARATVTRRVDTTLMQLLGSNFTDVTAIGVAAIVSYDLSPPILVLDPTAPDALYMHGTPDIHITGGGARSIQANSDSDSAFDCKGTPSLDVPGLVGIWGGPATLPCKNPITGGGAYLEPSSPVQDFLASVLAPTDPGAPAFAPCTVGSGKPGCPAGVSYGCTTGNCTVYYPGRYSSITVKNEDALFMPGLYYMNSGDMAFQSNSTAVMSNCSAPVSPDPKTGCGMVVYFAGNGQQVTVAANAGSSAPGIALVGDTLGTYYSHIVFFSRHTGSSNLGGGGAMTVTGTVYLPNQSLDLGGGSGSNTTIIGNILVDTLSLGGNGSITMTLDSRKIPVRQVALVR